MPGSGEPAHVGTDLGDDHLSRQVTDAGDGSQQPDRGAERGEVALHFLVDPVNGSLQRINLAQMEPQQEAMPLVEPLRSEAPHANRSAGALTPRCTRVSKWSGSVSPPISASRMARPETPRILLSTEASLRLASSSVF